MADHLAGRTVLVAGAGSASGHAAVRALVGAGARVVAAGRDVDRLAPLRALGARTVTCDLTDPDAVTALAARLETHEGGADGMLHLVGGWRGGGGLPGQSENDYRALEGGLTALRHLSRALWPQLLRSTAARIAIVSSTAVVRPLAGGANYAAVKAAEEAWMRSVAHGFAKETRDAGEPLRAAAVVFRVRALAGLEDDLAARFCSLWEADASAVNDTVITLGD